MPNIVVCFKWVIDETYLRRAPGGGLDFSSVDYKLSDYDRNAIEEAVRIRTALGGTVTGITVGPPEAAKGVKDALSRGMDAGVFIADPAFVDLDPSQTVSLIAQAVRNHVGPFDLIICGEGSGDLYAQQVGPRLAEALGIDCVAFATQISLEGGTLTAQRRLEGVIEVVTAPLPALVTVLPEINTPRIPGVKDTLMAGKKPVRTLAKGDLGATGGPRLQTLAVRAAAMERACEKFGVEEAEVIRFVDALKKRGVLA